MNTQHAAEPDWEQVLAAASRAGTDTLGARLGIEFVSVDAESIVATMPVDGNRQPAGLLHGGAHVVLAETLGSMHAHIISGQKTVVGVDLNATHVRGVKEGLVTGEARVNHAGRRVINHEVRMTDEAGRLLSIVRITNMVLG